MNHNYIILFLVFFACLAVRTSYELLKKSGKISEQNTPAFITVLVAMILLWVSWFAMCPMDAFKIDLPAIARMIGLALFVVGIGLAFTALAQLKGVEHIDHLVTTGLFSITRHPMYVGFVFWIVGWAIYHGAALSLVPGMVCIGNIVFWARLEDERLLVTYGERYKKYKEETLF